MGAGERWTEVEGTGGAEGQGTDEKWREQGGWTQNRSTALKGMDPPLLPTPGATHLPKPAAPNLL